MSSVEQKILPAGRTVIVIRLWVVGGMVRGVVEDVQTGARVPVDSLAKLQTEVTKAWRIAGQPHGRGLR